MGKKAGTKIWKVLVALDGSDMSDKVIKRSGQLAKSADFEVTLFTAIEAGIHFDDVPDDSQFHRERQEKAGKILDKAKKTFNKYDIQCKTEIAMGPPAEEIVRFAEENHFDMIFMGSRGLGSLKRMLLGSVAEMVVKHAHCAVIIIR